ncbi:MAG: fused MFS/spermidine synthase [Candidatus Xenobia bacterium]
MGRRQAAIVTSLLFASGFCALIYQTSWLREFRLIFGASTASTAAVLAIFMAGLGAGSAWLGRAADRSPDPLARYGMLECGIAVSAALTPLLLEGVRRGYEWIGGTALLSGPLATLLRLLLSALVLAIPTFLMGGTLPAAARSVQTAEDAARHDVSLLYGSNTLGAVLGCLLATFYLFERLGDHATLWLASALNLAVGATAILLSRTRPHRAPGLDRVPMAKAVTDGVSRRFVLTAAGIVGGIFFLMELVWYRLLASLLGGTTYTFGLILGLALLGVGAGGVWWAGCGSRRRPGVEAFALTCALEAGLLAAGFALGDRVAVLALLLRSLRSLGFGGLVLGWALVAGTLIVPAAFVSGVQFPLLISLLGTGAEGVGADTGAAYAANTAGAIVGSLAGGFYLLPVLTACGLWKLICIALAGTSLGAVLQSRTASPRRLTSLGLALLCMLALTAPGPTAFWRESPIGAGRYDHQVLTPNSVRDLMRAVTRTTLWEADGMESAVALIQGTDGPAFLQNGKSDGSAIGDAPTQIWSGLTPALLHPPRRVLVIGLGTGSTAGWLGAVPGVERVDVVELEPAILRVAADCAAVNHGCLSNPKVHIHLGDGREFLLTTRNRYDLIVSEPSNPYRAGVASLFTREYYQAAARRLTRHGMFCQWMQGYEVNAEAIKTFLATFTSVYPYSDLWTTEPLDLLLLGCRQPMQFQAGELRARLAEEPFRTALLKVYESNTLEGFLGHHVANGSYLQQFVQRHPSPINTDDRNLLEYVYARNVGRRLQFSNFDFLEDAHGSHTSRPPITGRVDWERVTDAIESAACNGGSPRALPWMTFAQVLRTRAKQRYLARRYDEVRELWQQQPQEPQDPVECMLLASAEADAGDAAAQNLIDRLRPDFPVEAASLQAHLACRDNHLDEAVTAIHAALTLARTDPWPDGHILDDMLNTASLIVQWAVRVGRRAAAQSIFDQMQVPLCLNRAMSARYNNLIAAAYALDGGAPGTHFRQFMAGFGPDFPWSLPLLRARVTCYRNLHDPVDEDAAQRDLETCLDSDLELNVRDFRTDETAPATAMPGPR